MNILNILANGCRNTFVHMFLAQGFNLHKWEMGSAVVQHNVAGSADEMSGKLKLYVPIRGYSSFSVSSDNFTFHLLQCYEIFSSHMSNSL